MKTLKFFGYFIVMCATCYGFIMVLAAFKVWADTLCLVAALGSILLFFFFIAGDKKLYQLKAALHVFVLAELLILASVFLSRSGGFVISMVLFLIPAIIDFFLFRELLTLQKSENEKMDIDYN